MRIQIIILLLLNAAIHLSGQDSLGRRYSVYYPDGKKYTGNTSDPELLADEFEEKGRVWLDTVANDKTDQRSVIAFKLFTSIPLWVYTVDKSSEIDRLIKSVNPEDLMTSGRVQSELQKHIKRGTLTDVFILQTLGRPDKLTYYDEKNKKVSQWTYSKLHLYLIFTNRIVTNYINISDHK